MAVNAAMVLVAAMLASAPAGAETAPAAATPERERALRMGRELTDHPAGAEALVLVEELWQAWDLVGPEPVVGPLEQVASSRDGEPLVRDRAAWRLAEARLRTGQLAEATAAADQLGVVRDFVVVGPLDNEGDGGFDRAWPPEEHLTEPLDVDTPLDGVERPVRWRRVEVPDPLGRLRLEGYLRPSAETCGYVATAVGLERPRDVVLRVASEGAVVLWVNGVEALRDGAHRRLAPDRYALAVSLPAGVSRVVAKVCGDDSGPVFALRVTDRRGQPLGGDWSGGPELLAEATPRMRRAPRAAPSAFRDFWRVAEGRARGDRLLAARYLLLTGGDDPAEPLAPDLAEAAATARPTVESLVVAAALSRDRNLALERLEQAAALDGSDPRVRSLLARLIAAGPSPHRALPMTAAVLRDAPGAVTAAMVRARLLGHLGLPLAGLRQVARAMELAGPVPALLEMGARLAREGRRPSRAHELTLALSGVRHDSAAAHRALAEASRDRAEAAAAARHVADLERVAWHDVEARTMAARLLEQVGSEDQAEAALLRLISQAPEAHEGHGALARLLAGLGRREDALAPARAGLALRPQDSALRELVAHITEREPFEDEFIEAPEDFLARRGEGGGEHARWLLDLTVVRVHPSGLASRFRQVAVEILDEEGARDMRTEAMVYVPEEQEVTLRRARVFRQDGTVEEASGRYIQRMADPAVRMYYDERAQVVELPRLRPGDVVEYAYRIDDVATQNLMGDYFGDLVLLQGREPRRRAAYVLVHPPERQIHVSAPTLSGLRATEECDEARCLRVWEALDVPRVRVEEGMPPLAEVAARLHVSSYGEWETIGRWYWGLVRDQLVPDDALRRVVEELVDGLEDDEARVRAIHGWVVEHTRYVALEFGIHGYQPYRVTQVVDRGFGDCKDKASLMVTMLGLAGVDAALVLLRTRGGGRVPAEPPSLAIFDHAIAYVPSLDRFLDGTAEQSGTRELPWMDQGVTALLVFPGGESRLVTTPLDGPDRNLEQRRLTVRLGSDRAAVVHARTTLQGAGAARMRYHFQAPALRRERLEASLGHGWPGATLLEHSFHEIQDREQAVDVEVRFEAPDVATSQGDRTVVQPARPANLTRQWARRSTRRTALELGMPPHVVEEERTIVPPAGSSIVELPSPVSLSSRFGALSMEASRDGETARIRTRLTVLVDRVAPDDYADFRQFCQQVDEALERRVVLQ